MAKKKDKVKYVLTIEHIEGEDRCEYIQEEVIQEPSSKSSWVYGEIDLTDYFSDSDITCILEHTIGKS